MITSIEISNFRGISKLSLTDLKRFNILIGKNDARKSTILEAIYSFKAISAGNPPHDFKSVIRGTAREQLARELWHNYSTKVDPILKIVLDNVKFSLKFHSGFDLNTVELTLSAEGKGNGMMKLDSRFRAMKENSIATFLSQLGSASLVFGLQKMNFFNEAFRQNIQYWESEISSKLLPPVDIHDKSITDFSKSDYMEGMQRLSLTDTGVYIDSLGEGHKSGLALLTIINGLKDSTILIEEIETHQHPTSLKDLIENLVKICIKNNNQVFVTTHSPEVLQLFSKSTEALLLHLQKRDDSAVMVNRITSQDVNMIRDIGWDLGNLLKYEKFVIVEGIIDHTVIRHAFYKLKNYWPEEIGINILIAGGFRKQKELLKTLSTKEKSIFIQRDYDDKTEIQIKNSICDGFKELEQEGYLKSEDADKIILENNSGIIKKLMKNNILVTGLPQQFPSIKKYTTDDYILAILQKEPTILQKINAKKNTVATIGNNSKDLLTDMLGSYDADNVSDIINESNPKNFPLELVSIMDKIETSQIT